MNTLERATKAERNLLRLAVKHEVAKDQAGRLEAVARAVIAAGRPHFRNYDLSMPCRCLQCAAWDELAKLLKML